VPALKHLGGPYLDLVRDALNSRAALDRGLFTPSEVTAMLNDPNGNLTPLRGNPLWQIGLLELWLAQHVDGATLP
jgi:asparagine synthase (glutamine-hydrolysing)